MPVGFFVALIWAMALPYPGQVAASWKVDNFLTVAYLNNTIVFLLSGITLQVDQLKAMCKSPLIVLYGILTINFITTVLCVPIRSLPLQPEEFAIGLSIFSVVPTTLGT